MIRKEIFTLGLLVLLSSCGDTKDSETPTSPRIRKETKIEAPSQNQTFTRGTSIPLQFSSSGAPIDSIAITIGDQQAMYRDASFEVTIPTNRVGNWQIRAKVYCGENSETHYRKVIILPENPPAEMTYSVVATYPHDTQDYTQGLLIKDGFLYESTGRKGESAFKKKNLRTGKTLKTVNLSSEYFGEGLAAIDEKFYQLTWTSGEGFVYNADMEQIRTFNYEVQGWGLTTYNDQLLLTDETEKLYFVDPSSFTIVSEIEAYDDEGKVDSLNELEIIDGLIYANVYLKDYVVVIDPETGEILQKIDFSGLLTAEEAKDADVLNGIAIDPETNKIYVTGKWWPTLFEVKIEEKPI